MAFGIAPELRARDAGWSQLQPPCGGIVHYAKTGRSIDREMLASGLAYGCTRSGALKGGKASQRLSLRIREQESRAAGSLYFPEHQLPIPSWSG